MAYIAKYSLSTCLSSISSAGGVPRSTVLQICHLNQHIWLLALTKVMLDVQTCRQMLDVKDLSL